MIKKLFTAVLMLVFSQTVIPQGWHWIDTGLSFILYDVSFPSGQSDIGYAVGSSSTYNGDGVILKTTDGGASWFQISVGTIPGLEAVCFTSVDVGYAGGWQNYFIKTTDGGATWTPQVVNAGIWYFNNIEFWDANNGIAVGFSTDVFVTTDAGATWTAATGMTTGVQDICYADANTLFLVGGDEIINKSTDGGLTWTEIYSGIFQYMFLGVEFYNANYGMVGGEDGKVLVTTNGGTSWATSAAGGYGLMRSIYIFNEDSSYVVGTPEQVYKTTNGGSTWFSDFTGAGAVALYKVKFTENNIGIICGSGGKILINTDYMFVPVELISFSAIVNENTVSLSWSTATETNNSGFQIERKTDQSEWKNIGFVPGYGTSAEPHSYIFKDAHLNEGRYTYSLKQVDYDGSFEYSNEVKVDVVTPSEYSLNQNYPNPFNPSTTINFSIPINELVTLTVYNSLGEEVTILMDKELNAGQYTVNFDASGLPSGIYVLKLKAGSFVDIKKMNLLK